METLDFDETVVDAGPGVGDDKLVVHFYMGYLRNDKATRDAGRPIYDDMEFIKIRIPGDRTSLVQRPVRPEDKRRFPQQYAAFKQGQESRVSGTPLAQWPIVSRGLAEELRYLGFHTVEQIAEANDTSPVRGLQQLKIKARQFLEAAAGSTAPVEALEARLEETEAKNAALEKQIAELKAALDKKKG